MAQEVQTQADSSPVEMQDPFNGQTPTLHEFNAYRVSGEVPARFAPAEDAESDPAEPAEGDEPENASDPAPENDQEPPEGIGHKARRRFEKLLSEKKELERQLAAHTVKQDDNPAPSTAPQAQQFAPVRPEPTVNDTNADGTLKYADYGAFVKDLGKWSAEQTLFESRQRDIQQQQMTEAQSKVERDRERYGKEFDKVIEPTAAAIMGDKSIPMGVKRMLASSDVLPELIYTIGTDEKTMQKLVRISQTDPQKAMFYIAELSAGIRQELAAETETPETVSEPRRTTAPKPPSPVSGASSRSFDVSDESLSADDWARKRNAQIARRGRS